MVVKQQEVFSRNLEAKVAASCKEMNDIADTSIADINSSVREAEDRINKSRDRAIKLLSEYVAARA